MLDIVPAQTLPLVKSFLPSALKQLSSKSRILQPPKRNREWRGEKCAAGVLLNFEGLKLRRKKVWLEAVSLPLQSVRQTFYKSTLKRSRRAPCMAPSQGPAERRGSALINPASHTGDCISWPRYITVFYVCWTVHHCDNWRIKNQLDVTYYFIVLLIGSTCFGHYYAHHQELATIVLTTTLVVSFLVCCRLEVRCG